MTASNADDNKNEIASGTPHASPGRSEIDRIVSEIEDLQKQMATLSIPESSVSPYVPDKAHFQAELSQKKPAASPEISDLFKEIEGGEESLLAETLAGLPTGLDSNVKEGGEGMKESEQLESESMLAAVLTPKSSHIRKIEPEASSIRRDNAVNHNSKHASRVTTKMDTPQKENFSENSLSMTVTGQMSLKLNFGYEGQEIFVHFNTDMIHIQFSEGTEFKIPVKRSHSKKVA